MSWPEKRRITPLNLPAGLKQQVAGNPAITRIESVPANCFPGLDVDVRNLDRRFFPGLVFEFVFGDDSDPQVKKRGARLVQVDQSDPDLKPDNPQFHKELKTQLGALSNMLSTATGAPSNPLPDAVVVLDSLTAGPNSISLIDSTGVPFNWDVTWRIVRSLEAGPLTIGLSRFDGTNRIFLMSLKGWRREFLNATGEISTAYQAGELTQSLCSPWQHDFRGCACTYWASNHPDIAMAAHPADIAELDDEGPDQDRAGDPTIWMRWELEKRVAPRPAWDSCRAVEMDHYEINERWKELNFVLEGREQLTPWVLSTIKERPEPLEEHMFVVLDRLAGMEQALALEYLYARYTVRFYNELCGEEHNHAVFIAHELLNVAIGEMMHLRWVNDLLTGLRALKRLPAKPALKVGHEVPRGTFVGDSADRSPEYKVIMRAVMQRPLDEAMDDFLAAEAPSGTLEGQYAKILRQLRLGWPNKGERHPELIELVERIIADGVDHYVKFREVSALLKRPEGKDLVKRLTNVQRNTPEYLRAKDLYGAVIEALLKAYGPGGNGQPADEARQAMTDLDWCARDLARHGLALPFIDIAKQVAEEKLRE